MTAFGIVSQVLLAEHLPLVVVTPDVGRELVLDYGVLDTVGFALRGNDSAPRLKTDLEWLEGHSYPLMAKAREDRPIPDLSDFCKEWKAKSINIILEQDYISVKDYLLWWGKLICGCQLNHAVILDISIKNLQIQLNGQDSITATLKSFKALSNSP